jgi:hypothetical protein
LTEEASRSITAMSCARDCGAGCCGTLFCLLSPWRARIWLIAAWRLSRGLGGIGCGAGSSKREICRCTERSASR